MAEPCHGCAIKEHEKQGLREQLANEQAGRQAEVAGLKAQGEALEKQAQEAQKTLAEAQGKVDIPDLATVIAHCEGGSCPGHAKEWGDLKARIVEAAYANLPKQLVEQKAEELGLIPHRIVISGMGLGGRQRR